MNRNIEKLRTETNDREICRLVQVILIEERITNTKLANIIGSVKQGINYKLSTGSFSHGQINKLLNYLEKN
jgi:hypothetical protein